jgi:type VI protein secretion system component VasK
MNTHLHSSDGSRRKHGDAFIERLLWHSGSGVVAALLVWGIQTYVRTDQATAANLTSRVTNLEIQMGTRTSEMQNTAEAIREVKAEIVRLRESIEKRR